MQRRLIRKLGVDNPLLTALHLWDSDNLVFGTNLTTATDIGSVGGFDMSNPSAATNPVFNAIDSNFNNKPSLTMNGDYLKATTSGFRESDQSGIIINVFRFLSTSVGGFFSVGKDGANSNNIFLRQISGKYQLVVTAPSVNLINSTIGSVTTDSRVVTNFSTGSEYGQFVNQTKDTVVVGAGSNNGSWFGDFTGSNNISIGARVAASVTTDNMEWVFTGYFPYVNDATTLEIIEILKTKYGIV